MAEKLGTCNACEARIPAGAKVCRYCGEQDPMAMTWGDFLGCSAMILGGGVVLVLLVLVLLANC